MHYKRKDFLIAAKKGKDDMSRFIQEQYKYIVFLVLGLKSLES